MDKFERYADDPPLLHSWDKGVTYNTGEFDGAALRKIRSLVGKGSIICETGVGNSTIAFLFSEPRKLISVAPDRDVWGRIFEYCDTNGIGMNALQSVVGYSEDELPRISEELHSAEEYADFFLVDGAHHWPTVFVDVCYANAMLRKGGLLALDDVQIWQINILAKFLSHGPDYRLCDSISYKTPVFQKLTEGRKFTHWSSFTNLMEESHSKNANRFEF